MGDSCTQRLSGISVVPQLIYLTAFLGSNLPAPLPAQGERVVDTGDIEYTIRRATGPLGEPVQSAWAAAETAEITHYQREDSGFRPPACARVLYDDHFLAVRFCVEDHYVRAVAEKWNDMVCQDSCVEFFVAPRADSGSDDYFNFEVNCGGTMLLYRCPSSAGGERRHVIADDGATIRIAASLPTTVEPEIQCATEWSVEYHVPWTLFHKYFDISAPTPGTTWHGNFYKCGDRTSHPHWGSWAPLETPTLGFHQPQYFRPLHFSEH